MPKCMNVMLHYRFYVYPIAFIEYFLDEQKQHNNKTCSMADAFFL